MSFVKYRLKEVATDFGTTPKAIADIISRYYEKPKSNTQVLNDQELNAVFDYMTQHNQIDSIEQVFAVKAAPKAEPPKQEAPKAAAPQQSQQPSRPQQQGQQPRQDRPQGQQQRPQGQQPRQDRPQGQQRPQQQPQQPKAEAPKPQEPERKRERRVVDTSAVQVNANRFADVDNLVDQRVQDFQGGKQRIGGKGKQQQNKKDNKFKGNKA